MEINTFLEAFAIGSYALEPIDNKKIKNLPYTKNKINAFPLSFKQYLSFCNFEKNECVEEKFNKYIKYGGIIEATLVMQNDYLYKNTINGIYNTIILKRIIEKYKLIDVKLIEKIIEYLINNTGKLISAKQISDCLNNKKIKVSPHTMITYIKLIENSGLIYRVPRYDILHKRELKTLEKYYISDVGLRNAIIEYKENDYSKIIENIIYLELLRRGYKITIGKLRKDNSYDIDFIAEKENMNKRENKKEIRYYQIALTLFDKNFRKRKIMPLKAIDKKYERIILTMDTEIDYIIENDIKCKNIIEFLLE